ncbi:MAG: Recombinase [Candidatus Amesbacteria bacterium GW2011_GWA2_47_11b]|uniref:Recombinase n=2 Tax=Candidatus Amesiibacteriota TaxID=1752730 RepID=A0A0G1RKU5_9BACT|nr:MAG: Recombinase [Microgenomates group bacterium GW2011_GWC1_46_20]KKU57751.1 MAG: Recombinase [Candidatus Amesbacteria bacterium GW2011_GWA2_47_11b]KKU83055.1 MAG: Recombinase [Candidatus Amesbacteria bacterium GW2011_GWC2_47_8]
MEENKNEIKSVVAYLRKSSEDDAQGQANKQLNSMDYQRSFAQEAITKYNLRIEKSFEDDKTGYEAFVRDDFQEMLDYLKEHKGKVEGIVCTEISRLARNFADGGMVLWYLQNGTIKYIFTPSKVFTNSSSDQLMVAIEFAMSKKSSDEGSYRTKAGMKSKAQKLRHPARPAVLGYVTEGLRGQKLWKIDPVIGPMVRVVFEQFATGKYTLQEIADFAYSIGLKSTAKRSTTGKISKNTWLNRLQDLQYTGIFYHKEERIVGEYEWLIPSELFYEVQDVLQNSKHPKTTHMTYAYSGIARCGLCGRMLSGTHKKGITYYRCDKRGEPCKNMARTTYVDEKTFEARLIEEFSHIEIDQETWSVCRDYVSEMNQPEKIKIKEQIRKLGERIAYEERIQVEAGRKFADDKILQTDYEKLIKDSNLQIALYRSTLVKCENIVHELDELMYNFLDNVKYVTKRLAIALPENKIELITIFCENLVWKDGKARFDWKKPYFILAKQPNNSTVLRR